MSANGTPPAFLLDTDAFLGSTAVSLMELDEIGAYVILLCHAWNDVDCGLPDNDRDLAKLSRLGRKWHTERGRRIRKCFRKSGHKLISPRLLQERKRLLSKQLAGRKGGEKRAANAAELARISQMELYEQPEEAQATSKQNPSKPQAEAKLLTKTVNSNCTPPDPPAPADPPEEGRERFKVSISFPPALLKDSKHFTPIWERWLDYLVDRNSRLPSIHTMEAHLTKLAAMSKAQRQASIASAIAKGWTEPADPPGRHSNQWEEREDLAPEASRYVRQQAALRDEILEGLRDPETAKDTAEILRHKLREVNKVLERYGVAENVSFINHTEEEAPSQEARSAGTHGKF